MFSPAAPLAAFAQVRHPADLVRFEVGDARQLPSPWLQRLDDYWSPFLEKQGPFPDLVLSLCLTQVSTV